MTNEERKVIELALEALQMLHDENMDYLTRNKLGGENNQCMVFARETITAIKEALAQPETPHEIGQRIAKTGGGISHLWSAVSQDDEIAEAERGFKEALAQPDQDEVDIRSRLYQRIHELETQLAQPERDYERGFIDGMQKQMQSSVDKAVNRLAQPEQEYGVVAGVGKGVEIPAGVKYYYIEPKLPPQRQPLKYEEYSALAETYTIDYGLLDCVDNHLYKPPTALRNKT